MEEIKISVDLGREPINELGRVAPDLPYDGYESPYCDECGACGEPGCCPPEKCKYWPQYKGSYDDACLELSLAENKIKELEHPSNWCVPVAVSFWAVSVLLKISEQSIDHWGTLGLCFFSLAMYAMFALIKRV